MNSRRLSVLAWSALAVLSAFLSPLNAETPDFLNFKHYEEPTFPFALTMTTVSQGFATVAYVVNAEGRIDDAVALEASHPAFGQAVVGAMRTWEIVPGGEETPRRRELVQYLFTREHAITSLTQKDAAKSLFSPSQDDAKAVHFVNWNALTPPPVRKVFVAPTYPAEARARGIRGSVTVNFVVDETGVVRVPTIVKSVDPLLSAEVLRAVQQWRFAPPTLKGQPVNVDVQREFSFAAKE